MLLGYYGFQAKHDTDNGLWGFSWPQGSTIKLFIFFGDGASNLTALDNVSSELRKLACLIDVLEEGELAVADKDHPVLIPSAKPHAVITISPGPMYATNFITAGGGASFLRWLRLSPNKIDSYDRAAKQGLVQNVLVQVKVSLQSPRHRIAFLCEWAESVEAVKCLPWSAPKAKQTKNLLDQALPNCAWEPDADISKRIRDSWPFRVEGSNLRRFP